MEHGLIPIAVEQPRPCNARCARQHVEHPGRGEPWHRTLQLFVCAGASVHNSQWRSRFSPALDDVSLAFFRLREQRLGCRVFIDQHRLTSADEIACPERSTGERSTGHDVAEVIETHDRDLQRSDVATCQRAFLPAAATQIGLDWTFGIGPGSPSEAVLESDCAIEFCRWQVSTVR